MPFGVGLCLALALAFQDPVEAIVSTRFYVPREGVEVPMGRLEGRPVVTVTINGSGPYQFVVDTGASATMLDRRVAEELGLPASEVRVEGYQMVNVASLGVGCARAEDEPMAVADLRGRLGAGDDFHGIMAAASFPGAVFTFDFARSRFRITRGALGEPDDASVFAYKGAVPVVPLKVGEATFMARLDTGDSKGVTLPVAAAELVRLGSPPVPRGQVQMLSGTYSLRFAPVLDAVRVGEVDVAASELCFVDLPNEGGPPRAYLGCRALQGLVVELDAGRHRVRLSRG